MRTQRRETRKQVMNHDGYINSITKYGTRKDAAMAYRFTPDPMPDVREIEMQYEQNGLFARIVDAPAESALAKGYTIEGVTDDNLQGLIRNALDFMQTDDKLLTAVKWARLFGGSLAVLICVDGGGLDAPLDTSKLLQIDDMVVFDKTEVSPDYSSIYSAQMTDKTLKHGKCRYGIPEYFNVCATGGTFRVHESRCLVFRNGILPRSSSTSEYRFWGVPEYARVRKELREAITTAGLMASMAEKSVQPVYSMAGLRELILTDEGEDKVVKRLEAIDMSRGITNTIIIDSEGENYDFRQFNIGGLSETLQSTYNMISAVTNIPQTILFGRSPAGENATGESDFEIYSQLIRRIQSTALKSNIERLLDYILIAAKNRKIIDEAPDYRLAFTPLKSVTESEKLENEALSARISDTKARTAKVYLDAGILSPLEVRKKLASDKTFDIDTLLDDLPPEEAEKLPEKDTEPENPSKAISEQN